MKREFFLDVEIPEDYEKLVPTFEDIYFKIAIYLFSFTFHRNSAITCKKENSDTN